MTADQLISERRSPARKREGLGGLDWQRLLFVVLALAHAIACRLIQQHVLVDSGVFTFMGLRWFDAPVDQEIFFVALSAIPALTFLPVRLTRSSDLLLIVFYGTVFVPATALFPNLATGDMRNALEFTLVSTAGFYIATAVARVRIVGPRGAFLSDSGFDVLLSVMAVLVMISYVAFVSVQVLDLDFTRTYEYRAAFGDEASNMSPIMLYIFVNSALALSPFMIVRGLSRGNYLLIGLAIALASYTFIVTSFRSFLFVTMFVAALTYILRLKLPASLSIMAFFIAMGATTFLIDTVINSAIPLATFSLHYRLFGNSATITSAYLDFFTGEDKFYYSQSFMHFALAPPTAIPYQLLVGQHISSVEGVWANGNIVSDAFANLGYPGILLIYLLLGLILALYNTVTQGKDITVAALTLVASGFYLSNGGLQSAVLSGGLGMTVLLLFWSPRVQAGAKGSLVGVGGGRLGRRGRSPRRKASDEQPVGGAP